ncbi:MAG: ABC-2 transporter permease [Clostridiaceae bacterium]|nr:ABC-2 transporter permease [Clostridiaceae bacterium]
MKGLILKDFYNLTKQYKIILVLVIFYLLVSVSSEDTNFFGGVVSILMVMQVITTLSYDEKSNWDRYALTMPISRSDLVLSKYILGGILLAVAFAVNFIFRIVAGSGQPMEALIVSVATTGVGLFFMFLILPVLFKFGAEKGRYMMMLIFFIPTGFLLLMSRMGLTLPEAFMRLLPTFSVLFLILAGIISVNASLAIYKRKEM